MSIGRAFIEVSSLAYFATLAACAPSPGKTTQEADRIVVKQPSVTSPPVVPQGKTGESGTVDNADYWEIKPLPPAAAGQASCSAAAGQGLYMHDVEYNGTTVKAIMAPAWGTWSTPGTAQFGKLITEPTYQCSFADVKVSRLGTRVWKKGEGVTLFVTHTHLTGNPLNPTRLESLGYLELIETDGQTTVEFPRVIALSANNASIYGKGAKNPFPVYFGFWPKKQGDPADQRQGETAGAKCTWQAEKVTGCLQ